MGWGVGESAALIDVSIDEIRRCNEDSFGPSFVVLCQIERLMSHFLLCFRHF